MIWWYIGPWQGVQDDANVCWQGPSGTFSAIDFRSLAECSMQPGIGDKAGAGLFASRVIPRDMPGDWRPLGHGNWHDIKSDQRMIDAFPKRRGVTLNAPDLVGLVRQSLLNGDPSGDEFAKPLMAGRGALKVQCGGFSHSERFKWGDPATNRIRDVIRSDFRKQFTAAQSGVMERNHHRRILDALCETYSVEDWREFVPDDIRSQVPGRLPHSTTITESFNKSDSDTLGPDLTWTEVLGDLDVSGNSCVSSSNPGYARAESDLSSADHYAQVIVTAFNGSNREAGPAVRFAAAASTFYAAVYKQADTNTYRLIKVAAGTISFLSNASETFPGLPKTTRLTIAGSGLSGTYDTVEKVTTTDTAITGNTRCGLFVNQSGSKTMDSFEASDDGGSSPILYTQIERGTRGYRRGMYAGGNY